MNNEMYINLLKKVLVDYHRVEKGEYKPWPTFFNKISKKFVVCQKIDFDPKKRLEGRGWPAYADTMIGMKRLENIEFCVKDVIQKNIPGDFIETGVWRGGATIFMKALLKAANDTQRVVWVADSFQGLPKPDGEKYSADKNDKHYIHNELAISMETVRYNFEKYDLLDDNVQFLKGWFKDTLPTAPIKKLAVLRLDGDMYESTMDAITALYPKLSKGGYLIVDDWGAIKACQLAINDYRKQNGITEEIKTIDWTGVYWRKEN